MAKVYSGSYDDYEKKLKRVMERMGVDKYNYDWNRQECYIEFTYHSQFYRFEHSLEKAMLHKQKITAVSDLFAQLVISLEDICRMSERGIYELSTWIEGMKALPPKKDIPACFVTLLFDEMPTSAEQVKQRYREIIKTAHPDKGGSEEMFKKYTNAYDESLKYLEADNG